jgi:chemotaxis protein MotB
MRLKFDRRSSRGGSTLWLVIFSDMSTNLMMFFLMLFAMTRMSMSDREMMVDSMKDAMLNKPPDISTSQGHIQKELSAISELKDVIAYGVLKQFAKLDIKDDKVKITLEMPFFFESGSAIIHPNAKKPLRSLVGPIKRFPSAVIVEGHTDNAPVTGGRYDSNWELSVARAVSVIDFMISNEVPPEKLIAGGYGEYHPAFPNDSAENMALNRRIEITIPRQDPGYAR